MGAGRTGESVVVKAGIRAGERGVDQELPMRNSGRAIELLGVGWVRGKSPEDSPAGMTGGVIPPCHPTSEAQNPGMPEYG